jgi:aspartyl protease family protein
MRAAIPLAIILVAIAVLVLFHGEDSVGGFTPHQIASFAWLSAMGVMVLGWVARRFQGQWTRALEALAFWLAVTVALVALYSYRFELAQFANRIVGEIAPGTVVVAAGGEVSVSRRADGSFALAGRINGHDTRFLFDTGASTVVLTAATARLAGLDPDRLDYSQAVSTANGRATAAPVVIDRLSIGGISEARVHALVARSGVLSENLLGLSFLDRLASFEVKNDRLTLRGGKR